MESGISMLKENGSKWKNFLKRAGICMAFTVIAAISIKKYGQAKLAEELSQKVLRFHVIANSDSEKDQELKLMVRDAVGAYMQSKLAEADSLEQSKAIVLENMAGIIQVAEDTIYQQGNSYHVEAALVWVDFPEKIYGDYHFPAGNYQALRLVIGQGEGKNWWCVMYPNMCFANSVYEEVDENAEEALREVLTAEEYEAIMESGSYEVEFKWLSFLNE